MKDYQNDGEAGCKKTREKGRNDHQVKGGGRKRCEKEERKRGLA